MENGQQFDKPVRYQIRVQGCLDLKWSDWFDGFTITAADDQTTLEGTVTDQSALHGMLMKIRDLGLPLLAVICLDCGKISDIDFLTNDTSLNSMEL